MMSINDSDFSRLVMFVREKYGINLEHKRQLVDARLSFDIARRGYKDFTHYVSDVIKEPDGDECQRMINRLSTNYTYFFREPDYIEQLGCVVLRDFFNRGKTDIKIWNAACSSGQEAYSLAMVLEAENKQHGGAFDFEITATDINTETLAAAVEGIYPAEEYDRIPVRFKQFALHRSDKTFQVAEKIRKKVKWENKNLLDSSADDKKYDIIFCRNVMIYFTPELRREMTERLHSALVPGGYLFTGATESIDLERKYFSYIAPAFYRKIAAGRNGEKNDSALKN